MLASLLSLGLVWRELDRHHQNTLQERFQLESGRIGAQLEWHMLAYAQILRGGTGLFAATDSVTRHGWRRYVEKLDLDHSYQGIQGVGFALQIRPEQLDAHIQSLHREGFPGYGIQPAGTRERYSSVLFLEPFSGRNLRAFGYDMLTEPQRRAAMERARDTGSITYTGKIKLVQETQTNVQAGVLAYYPVYANEGLPLTQEQRRAALVGWVYSPYRMNDLVEGMFKGDLDNIRLEIFDGAGLLADRLLYDSEAGKLQQIMPGTFTRVARLDLGGHIWTLRYRSLPGFAAATRFEPPWAEFTGILLISLLLFAITWALINTRRRAEDIAGKLTASLRESEMRFRAIIEASPVPLSINDDLQNITYLNAAFIRTFGYVQEDIPKLADWWPRAYPDPGYRAWVIGSWQERIERNLSNGTPFEPLEVRIRTRDGVERSVMATMAPLAESEQHLVALYDITELKQTQQRLEHLLSEQKAILENDMISLVKVRDRTILWANPAFEAMLGYAQGEFVGLSSRCNYPSEEAYQTLGAAAYPVLLSGQIFRAQIEHVRRDGSLIWVDLRGAMLDPESGVSLWGFIDITERVHAEAELEQYRRHLEELVQRRTAALTETEARASHILQSSADGLYGIDAAGMITFINPAASDLLGYTSEQVIGLSAHAVFHHSKPDGNPYPEEICPSHHALLQGLLVRVDNEVYWHADGHPVPVMYAMHPMLQDGHVIGAVVSFVDMSEQRAAAQAREQALAAAEHLARVRSEFLANMSHEIRTPINGVLGFAEIGYRNYLNSDKARDAFDKIRTSGKRLLGVINEILDFSKIEAGKLRVEHTETVLAQVVDHAVEIVQEQARAKHLELRLERATDLPETCLSDPLRLGQVLLNLLSNAVKFTASGHITLSVSRQGEHLVFAVADSGIGMSEQQLDRLFHPFEQADGSMTRKYGGTGLGLAISKRITELLGGEIRVQSQLGVGSTFEFSLPYIRVETRAEAASATEVAASPAAHRPLAGISILVAEDEPINQMLLEENLGEDGARVVMTGNGREAVERVLRDGPGAYDIVLMDIQMPEMNGFEATRQILALAPDLPILGQTAHAFAPELESCFAAGMVGHIAKPLDPNALVALVLRHVKTRDAH